MRLTCSLLFFAAVLFSGCLCPKPTADFKYKDKQINPVAVSDLMPDLATGKSVGCVHFNSKTYMDSVMIDNNTLMANKGVWYRSNFSQTGFAEYHLIGIYKGMNGLIVKRSEATTSRAYVLFVKTKCKRICLKGDVALDNLRDDFISISGDTLKIGQEKKRIDSVLKNH
jgi:hypothetical protein